MMKQPGMAADDGSDARAALEEQTRSYRILRKQVSARPIAVLTRAVPPCAMRCLPGRACAGEEPRSPPIQLRAMSHTYTNCLYVAAG